MLLHENMLSAEQWRQRFADEQFLRFRHGASVFIAADEPWAQTNIGVLLPGHEVPPPHPYSHNSHPNDLLLVPLYHQNGQIMALMSLDEPMNGLRPTESDFTRID